MHAAARVAWLSLGSNVGNRTAALARLRAELTEQGLDLVGASPEVLTRALGVTAQRDFLNQVVRAESAAPLEAREWLRRCKHAEHAAGRRTGYRWGPRRADADVLLLGERGELRVDDDDLRVPHPAIAERPFLVPLLRAAGAPASAIEVRSGGGPPAAE